MRRKSLLGSLGFLGALGQPGFETRGGGDGVVSVRVDGTLFDSDIAVYKSSDVEGLCTSVACIGDIGRIRVASAGFAAPAPS